MMIFFLRLGSDDDWEEPNVVKIAEPAPLPTGAEESGEPAAVE